MRFSNHYIFKQNYTGFFSHIFIEEVKMLMT